jgi:Uma2 family endonuclease
MSTVTKLIAAEEFALMPDIGRPTELVRGEIVDMNKPTLRHGQVCSNIVFAGRLYNREYDRIHVPCNDSGVIVERDPDTVCGPDVSFLTYDRIPKGPIVSGKYLDVVPEIAFEVISPSDRWSEISEKINEYLTAGVLVVCVLEPDMETVRLFFPDGTSRMLGTDEQLTFPEILPGFSVSVAELFA